MNLRILSFLFVFVGVSLEEGSAQLIHAEKTISKKKGWGFSGGVDFRGYFREQFTINGGLDLGLQWASRSNLFSVNLNADVEYVASSTVRQILSADTRLYGGLTGIFGYELFLTGYQNQTGGIPFLGALGAGGFVHTPVDQPFYGRFGILYFGGVFTDFFRPTPLHGPIPYGLIFWQMNKYFSAGLAAYFQAVFPGPLLVNIPFQPFIQWHLNGHLAFSLTGNFDIPLVKGSTLLDFKLGIRWHW